MVQTIQVNSGYDQGRVYQKRNFMTPGAGVLVLGRGHLSHTVKMQYFFLFHLYLWVWIRRIRYTVMMIKEWSIKFVNCMTTEVEVLVLGRGDMSYSENALFLYFFLYFFLFSQEYIRQTKCIVIMTKEGSTKL